MYSGFWITEGVGNNAFSFAERRQIQSELPRIWVPELILAPLSSAQIGAKIGFEEIDETEKIHSCAGLENFLQFTLPDLKKEAQGVLFDNHNHAFYFWHEALFAGILKPGSKLIHIDAHTDLNIPKNFLAAEDKKDLEKIFTYTNFELNVGNFIVPAMRTGCIAPEICCVNSALAVERSWPEQIKLGENQTVVLDIDLDFWNEALISVDRERSFAFVQAWLKKADFLTIATSPFFIDQRKALKLLRDIFKA